MKILDRVVNLKAKPEKLLAVIDSKNGQMTLAEGSIFSDGNFELNLPDIVVGYSFLSSFKNICKNINIKPESLKFAIVDAFWLLDSDKTRIGYIFQGSSQRSIKSRLGEKMISRWYANQSSHISGIANCGPNKVAVNFKLDLKKGWNEVIRHFQSDATVSIHTRQNSESMFWFMFEDNMTHRISSRDRFMY